MTFEQSPFDSVWKVDGKYCVGFVRGENNDLICFSKELPIEKCLAPICPTFKEAINQSHRLLVESHNFELRKEVT